MFVNILILITAVLAAEEAPPASPSPRIIPGQIMLETQEKAYPYKLVQPVPAEGALPLVVFLHGAGERGDDNAAHMRRPLRLLNAPHMASKPCFMLAMQCPKGESWAPFRPRGPLPDRPLPAMQALMEAIETVVAEYPVDPTRIYLTGLSMGGFGTWELAARRPSWFAAAVPICGGGRAQIAPALVDLPIWAFHGQNDQVVKEAGSRRIIDAIRAAGGRPAYSSLPGVGHNAWDVAYGPRGAMEWLFAQENPRPGLASSPAVKDLSD